MVFDDATVGTLILWGLAALGVFHLFEEAVRALRRARYQRQDVRDSSNQLRFVMAANFARRKVMERAEYKVFRIVEDEVRNLRGHRVFAQTSLGEVIKSSDWRAHSSINSKRADILVIAPDGYPLLAVEYQGNGHYQGNAAGRDAVKKEALRKAGAGYLEVSRSHSPDEVRESVRSALRRVTTSGGQARPSAPVPGYATR